MMLHLQHINENLENHPTSIIHTLQWLFYWSTLSERSIKQLAQWIIKYRGEKITFLGYICRCV